MKQADEKLYRNLAIYAGVYFLVVRPILQKIGIIKSKEEKIIDFQNSLPNADNPFSPVMYKTGPTGTKILTFTAASDYSARIYYAMGNFSDDEAKIYGIFRLLKTQSQVSFLAERFQQMYKVDLLDFLKRGNNQFNPASGLNSEELNIVIDIVNKLPKYK